MEPNFKLIREVAMAFYLIQLRHIPVFQMTLNIYFALASIVIVGVIRPFKSKGENNLEIINEVIMIMLNYHLMMFTDFI